MAHLSSEGLQHEREGLQHKQKTPLVAGPVNVLTISDQAMIATATDS